MTLHVLFTTDGIPGWIGFEPREGGEAGNPRPFRGPRRRLNPADTTAIRRPSGRSFDMRREDRRMPPLQSQIDELRRRQDAHDRRMDVADLMRTDSHKMLAELHQALMVPQYGQGEKSLLERMAEVTVAIESGDRATESLIKWLKRLAFVGAVLAAIGAYLLKTET